MAALSGPTQAPGENTLLWGNGLKSFKFFKTLLELSDQNKKVGPRVRVLTQTVINGDIKPQEFADRLQQCLSSTAQPHLVPEGLHPLRQALKNGSVTIAVGFPAVGIEYLPLDPLRLSFYDQLTTPVPTNNPMCNRFELKTTDGTHLFVHKDILSFASDVFRDMFDPNKPPEAQFDYLKHGYMELAQISGCALEQLIYFIYLGRTHIDFDDLAQELIEPTTRFMVKGFKEECEQSLIKQVDTMAKPRLEIVIGLAHVHNYYLLKVACAQKMVKELPLTAGRDTFLFFISMALNMELEDLTNWCVAWLKHNYNELEENAFMDELMDQEDGRNIVKFLMKHFLQQ